ncbi:MAG: hypothetical protein sL5_00580 [Candidatus Mesenet longicola]|uniref:Uncharacterized protein n=1 Tax=Candidatus Mesenet longicola TaxID=1892558 RepID=A0A8J3HUA2_9RICK|nr:MAG: hypothetical protein sGL2_00380 [Candidatus Mesenet longicola]GHM59065.1 MAG: hypothetical protein sL5_00580 [Candidatus Mesenet longicola]
MAITLPMIKKEIDELRSDFNNLKKLIASSSSTSGQINPDLSDKLDQIIDKIKKTSVSSNEAEAKLIKGNKIANDKHEARLELNGKNEDSIFSPVGYYFYDNKIYIYDRFKPETSIDLLRQYHFLKVVKTEEGEYKLAFCNQSGHEFHGILDDYEHINPVDIKSTKNIDLAKYYNKNHSHPSFALKASDNNYSNSQQHGVDVYEIGNGEKKVGSLIDEFGYYDSQNKFHYFNNYLGTQIYDPLSFTITKGDNQCFLHQMKEGTNNVDSTNDAMACSLVEYVANYVNGVYF